MITLKKLTWSNCFSYGSDNELDLNDNIVTQLVGTNGTGKSSIPLILEEVLFNKNSKGIKKADIPNREVNNGYDISLTFDVVDDKYKIDVVRRASIKVKLYKNGEDISSHTATNTYKTVEEILGLDFKTFTQIVYQNTNTSLQFLTATDTNRKKFLIDLGSNNAPPIPAIGANTFPKSFRGAFVTNCVAYLKNCLHKTNYYIRSVKYNPKKNLPQIMSQKY